MNSFLIIFLFVLTFLFYLHLKKFFYQSTDPNIYEIESAFFQKEKIEKVLSLRNPCLISLPYDDELTTWLSTHTKSELKLRCPNLESQPTKPLLEESGWMPEIPRIDSILIPPATIYKNYSIKLTSEPCWQYFLNERTYFMVSGDQSVSVKLIMPKHSGEWFSNGHCKLKSTSQEDFVFLVESPPNNNNNNNSILTLNLTPGNILSIPPFWGYQIIFPPSSSNSLVYQFEYRTVINTFAIFPYLIKYFLEKQNVRWKYGRVHAPNNDDEKSKLN